MQLLEVLQILNQCFLQTDFPVRERIFLLLDATQTSLGGSSGKFPQYYSAYYDLVVSMAEYSFLLFSSSFIT